jgi:hypothetical protein
MVFEKFNGGIAQPSRPWHVPSLAIGIYTLYQIMLHVDAESEMVVTFLSASVLWCQINSLLRNSSVLFVLFIC